MFKKKSNLQQGKNILPVGKRVKIRRFVDTWLTAEVTGIVKEQEFINPDYTTGNITVLEVSKDEFYLIEEIG